ncbi:MAG TPA: DNA glycosylase [Methylomirabilota bacterium]|nr:DNA glycosylase [Methylomirabilota bacterium]
MSRTTKLYVADYDLASTLTSGQAFRWTQSSSGAWEAVIHERWVSLRQEPDGIHATCATPQRDWHWLETYLQTNVDLAAVLKTLPPDAQLTEAVRACRGLRLLQQDPWECLASFILSSTKQIVQIRQIVASVCQCFGESVFVPPGHEPANSFPSAATIAAATEQELRACKMGFRAPYLHGSAQMIASGQIDLTSLYAMPLEAAREQLLRLPGVGRKIADCVLLFAFGFQKAFPVDVWVIKALCQLYFRNRKVPLKRLLRFTEEHFGPHAGYAQQYLFHYMRVVRPQQQKPA